MRKNKLKNIEQANIMLEQSYLKSKGLLNENNVQDFIKNFHTNEFFIPFLEAVRKKGLNVGNTEHWKNIMGMDRKQLQNTFELPMAIAIWAHNSLRSKKDVNDFNTVEGRVNRLNKFFNDPDIYSTVDYTQFKNIYNHFEKGGEIDSLKPELKKIYNSKYKPFTKEEFMEIFNKVKIKN